MTELRHDNPLRILSHGLELDRTGLKEVEFLENLPGMKGMIGILADPLPEKAWRMYANHFSRKARKAQDVNMTERWRMCELVCKHMPHGTSAWDALVFMTDTHHETGNKFCDEQTRGMFRDEHHIATHKEWLGRDIA